LSTTLKRKNKVIKITIRASKISGREDVLASYGTIKRILIKQFAQPANYTMEATLKVSIQEGDAEPVITQEKARYELHHMNK
jgi:hypothetical protein